MSIINETILGNAGLHLRFASAVRILNDLLSCPGQAVAAAQLEKAAGCTPRATAAICAALADAGLIKPAAGPQRDGWTLVCEPDRATLEDVFRGIIAVRMRDHAGGRDDPDPVQRDIDLLLMQATMAINQGVFRYLRQIPLTRLKAGGRTATDGWMPMRASRYDDVRQSEQSPTD